MKQRDNQHPEQRRDTIKSHHIEEHRHDPYRTKGKLAEPTVCPQCEAVFAGGRWQWAEDRPKGARKHTCPACRRINDRYPAGEVTLGGGFVAAHSAEIVGLICNIEAAEKREHPLQRIMAIEEGDGKLVVTTTDIHLPRRIGHALVSAYKGDLDTHYDESGYFIRMKWQRES